MKKVTEHIREHLLEKAGVIAVELMQKTKVLPTVKELIKSQWTPKFEDARMYRKIMGAFRYGLLGGKGKPNWNRVDDCIRRLKVYKTTGNDEILVDVANLCELEFVEGKHPNKHFDSADDGIHTERF